jgi:hypothetical protein
MIKYHTERTIKNRNEIAFFFFYLQLSTNLSILNGFVKNQKRRFEVVNDYCKITFLILRVKNASRPKINQKINRSFNERKARFELCRRSGREVCFHTFYGLAGRVASLNISD